jgi:DNA invertase Pin-like site-specific DNA recombinase
VRCRRSVHFWSDKSSDAAQPGRGWDVTTTDLTTPATPLVPAKVQSRHSERLAVIYVRQSTAQQVMEHRESTALQYALRRRAVDWGWPPDRVLVIDQDLGRSGASAEGRLGFQQLLAEVSLDHVGLVLGIEMSRLARSCKDWHQLLELCALFGTLLADTDGLYDPRDYNDRLLLGLKGTLSEAELHVLHQRMNQGRLNKARRGELFSHVPIGYVRLATGEVAIDPDQQVQSFVRLAFDKFDELGTLNALLRYLVRHDVHVPVRPISGADRGGLRWRRPNRQTLRNLLHNPLHAGAYTWGRRPVDPRAKVPGRPATGRKVAAAERCQVFLPGRCPAYITWERYEANRARLADNSARGRGAPRHGPSLLGGLLACGTCGRRMGVQYSGRSNRLRYACTRNYTDYGAPACQGVCGRVLDELVERLALQVLEPASVELSLAAAADLEAERDRLGRHWRQRLERARYESDRAARQYHAAEPENRLVARELEKRWEQALLELRGVEEARDRFDRELPAPLTDADREAVRTLAADLPALWHAPDTTPAERQTVVRHLVERVVLTAPGDREIADVEVRWAGGFVSHHELVRPVARYEQMRDYPALSQRILELRGARRTSGQIATALNAEGWRPPKRRESFTAGMVRDVLCRRGQATTRTSVHPLGEAEWWSNDLARELGLPHPTLYSWMRRGWAHARQLTGAGGRWVFWADAEELDRLRRLRTCPRGWYCRPLDPQLAQPKPRKADS